MTCVMVLCCVASKYYLIVNVVPPPLSLWLQHKLVRLSASPLHNTLQLVLAGLRRIKAVEPGKHLR